MIFNQKYAFSIQEPEKMSKESKTHKTGYIPPKIRITEMIMAGKRLANAKDEQFDIIKSGEITVPLTRRRGVDLVEVIEEMRRLRKKAYDSIHEQENARKAAQSAAERAKIEAEIRAEIVTTTSPA